MSTISTVFFGFLLAVCVTFAVQDAVFRSSYREIVALVGNDITMECSVNDLKASELVIWQNGSMVLSAGRQVYQPPQSYKVSIQGSSGDTFNLRIRNVTIYDAGNYSCQVTGRGTQYNQLVVNVPASIKFFPEGRTVTVVEEGELSVTCKAFGKPKPTIQWFFHGKEGAREMVEDKGHNTLMLSDIRRSDAGEYECKATNGVGVPATHKIEIEVEYAPSVAVRVPVIYVAPGQDTTIECFFSANPDVDLVRWYHNLSELNTEHQTNVKDNHRKTDSHDVWALDIRNLRPDQLGTYSCHAENKIGTGSDTVQLSPFPYDLKILGIRKKKYSEDFILSWTVSSPVKLLNFTIAIKQLNDSVNLGWRNFSIPVSVAHSTLKHSQEYTLQQLAANTNYTILIKARNLYGSSDWSETLIFHTSEEFDEGPSQITASAVELEFTISNESLFLRESRGTFAEPKTSPLLLILAFSLLKNLDEVIH